MVRLRPKSSLSPTVASDTELPYGDALAEEDSQAESALSPLYYHSLTKKLKQGT